MCGAASSIALVNLSPYFGITNYHYDQWLRLWLLGGPPTDRRTNNQYNGKHRGKFANGTLYDRLLDRVFQDASRLMKPDAVIYVRTDRREPTLAATKKALKKSFPNHLLTRVNRQIDKTRQTKLFGNDDPSIGDVDLVLLP